MAARALTEVDGEVLHSFANQHASTGADVYADDSTTYKGQPNCQAVAHSTGEHVRYLEGTTVHTNSVESFGSMLKRAHKDTFHRLSTKHLRRYVNKFAGRHNLRERSAIAIMDRSTARSTTGTGWTKPMG